MPIDVHTFYFSLPTTRAVLFSWSYFTRSQADVSWLLSLIDDPDRWEKRARDFQACVVCGQTEKPLALEELLSLIHI